MNTIRTSDGDRIVDDGGPIGLALSGGGLKAALFHIGVLARLAELDLLRQIDVISGTCGGAPIAALYHLHLKRALDADGDIDTDRLVRLVAALERDFLKVVQTDLRARLFENPLINLKRTAAHRTSARRLGDLLERHLFRPVWNGAADWPIEMRALAIQPRGDHDFNPVADNRKRYCKVPALVLNATVLGTGHAWRFDAERMGEPAAKPAGRRLGTAPRLAESPYRRLPEAHAGITLGQAVAASMATPGLLEPLHLADLYPSAERPSANLDLRLADGRLADAFGADALVDRGCTRLILADGTGKSRFAGDGLAETAFERARTLQLGALEAARPDGVVLIHMLREIEAPELTPHGPIERGGLANDRSDADLTSYGVERGLQKAIAVMRADVDAPSEIEATSLMADGYLIAKRTFQQQRQRGRSWTDALPRNAGVWRFTPMIEALSTPSSKLIKHLEAAKFGAFQSPRLPASQVVGLGFLASAVALTLVALAAFWSAFRPAADADRLWILTTIGALMLGAWLAGRYLRGHGAERPTSDGKHAVFAWMTPCRAIAAALPLALGARLRHRASRAFLKAGRLKKIGIEPVKAQKRAEGTPNRRTTTAGAEQAERRAA